MFVKLAYDFNLNIYHLGSCLATSDFSEEKHFPMKHMKGLALHQLN